MTHLIPKLHILVSLIILIFLLQEKKFYGCGDSDGTYTYNNSTKRYFSCKKKRGLFLSLADINPPPSSTALNTALQERVSQLEREMRDQTQRIRQLSSSEGRLRQEVTRLEGELREKEAMPAMIQREAREVAARQVEQEMKDKDDTITGLERNLQYKEAAISGLVDQLMRYRELHMAELDQARQETEHYQHLLREEQAQRQQLVTRIRGVIGDVRGDAASPQALELWELPREEVHISQTILGTGGWGYVARGTFRGQKVAVKCLHQGILSQHNETKLRREISIMSQVRHPNLLLLIGAVLTAEGRGPLIVTELLDRSLRSAYEDGLLEERSKVPVLRDVSSALTYLHSHRTPIIHRDVSSSNVLLEAVRDGQWKGKLSDFGSANLSHLASTPAEGAAVYAAPEVSTEDRSRQTPKIDVYSFGVLMCEVCLCRFPPERREFSSMLNEVRGRAPHMFPLSRDCTSHAHQNRPQMKLILQWLTRLKET